MMSMIHAFVKYLFIKIMTRYIERLQEIAISEHELSITQAGQFNFGQNAVNTTIPSFTRLVHQKHAKHLPI